MARLTVKVHPRARRSALAGRFGDAWKLDLAAPPVDGKANDECVRFFAELASVRLAGREPMRAFSSSATGVACSK